jgi:hypothetical protein
VDDVDRGLVRERAVVVLRGDLADGVRPFERAAGGAVHPADSVAGASEQRPVGRARKEQAAREQRGQPEERGACAAQQHRDAAAEQPADEAAVA